MSVRVLLAVKEIQGFFNMDMDISIMDMDLFNMDMDISIMDMDLFNMDMDISSMDMDLFIMDMDFFYHGFHEFICHGFIYHKHNLRICFPHFYGYGENL